MRGYTVVVRGGALVCALSLGLAGVLGSPRTTRAAGQPNQSCQNPLTTSTPGLASSAPGSAFDPNGTAGGHYAGTQPQNSKNPSAVSQYDVACAQVSGNPGHS
jgi:hypothetical protein